MLIFTLMQKGEGHCYNERIQYLQVNKREKKGRK